MRHLLRTGLAVLTAVLIPVLSEAQVDSHTAIAEAPPVGDALTADVIRDLPLGDNVYALLETVQPEVIADGFNSGGLNVGQDARVSGFLGSSSQTLFRIGDISISDPSGSGASLLFPSLLFWDGIRVTTGLMPIDMNTPGVGVTLEPRRPGSTWTRMFTGNGAGGGLIASAPSDRPSPITRLHEYADGTALVSGPLSQRVGLVAAATLTRGSHYFREALPDTNADVASGFAHVVFTPSASREVRVLTWVQHSSTPFDDWQAFRQPSATSSTNAVHAQSTLENKGSLKWRIFGGFTERSRTNDLGATPAVVGFVRAVIDPTTMGPVPQFIDRARDAANRRVAIGARLAPDIAGGRQQIEFGVDGEFTNLDASNLFTGNVQEAVNGSIARIWTYSAPSVNDNRSTNTFSGFASDVIKLTSALTLDAGIRLESVRGNAEDAPTTVSWFTALPHASVRMALGPSRDLRFGYARSANALTHDWLAFGDPAASIATVANAVSPNAVVSRVGPGTGGNASFSRIDPDLKRPTIDEFVIAYERRRGAETRYTLSGIIRRETNMLGVVNTGATAAGYSTISILDAGVDWANPRDDRPLIVYNRLPATFGRDAYLLTNPDQKAATAFALRMAWEHNSARWFTLFGATASAANGQVSNRGYGPLQNDQDQSGELFTNPNAATYARGRLFSDRAFTIKWTALYRAPGGWTVGGIARYQDGQPFSRMVVVPGLTQGTEAVQAYPNGGSRFTYTGTLDLRVQKQFTVGSAHINAIFDAYNLLTRSNEVEEYVFSDPALFRMPTAIEPPPAVHLGLRVTF